VFEHVCKGRRQFDVPRLGASIVGRRSELREGSLYPYGQKKDTPFQKFSYYVEKTNKDGEKKENGESLLKVLKISWKWP
jgi:hypothetical protein